MRVHFWGVRGSIPTPGQGTVRYGGNTSCVEVTTDGGDLFILDCGSGLRELGRNLLSRVAEGGVRGRILLSHTHWDHIQGFPFFGPAFVKGNSFDLYAARDLDKRLQDTLAEQMEFTYFPVTLGQMQSDIRFHELGEGALEVGNVRVQVQYLNHTSLCLGYRIEADGRVLCYCTDVEPNSRIFVRAGTEAELLRGRDPDQALGAMLHEEDRRFARFVQGADLLIHDAMYTDEEYPQKVGWGHSTAEHATRLSLMMGVRSLVLFHHEPDHDDTTVDGMVARCRRLAEEWGGGVEVHGAAEGLELSP